MLRCLSLRRALRDILFHRDVFFRLCNFSFTTDYTLVHYICSFKLIYTYSVSLCVQLNPFCVLTRLNIPVTAVDMDIRPLLVSEFEDLGLSISDDMLDECVIKCHTHKISPSNFVEFWIAHCVSSQIDANNLCKETLATLVKSFKVDGELKQTLETNNKKFIKKESNLNKSDSLHAVNIQTSLKSTGEENFVNVENETSISIVDEDSNINEESTSSIAGNIACEFGCKNVNDNDLSADIETICFSRQELWNNFIFGRINDQKFDNHVQHLVDDIIINNNLKPAMSFSEMVLGNDSTDVTISGSLKLIKKDLFLSSSHGLLKLDLSEIEHPLKPLFVNQILVLTGTKSNTKVFTVRKLYTNSSLPLSKTLPEFSEGNMKLIVAAGPFFSESSPHGKSLKSLIQKTIEMESKLVVLFGPIFESDFITQLNKTSLESVQKSSDEILYTILKPLLSNSNTQNTKVVVFSSWKDVNNYAFYPTPPSTESMLPSMYPNNVFMVSDPCVFSVNGITIAGNTSDALAGLHASAINQTQEEMFTKLAKHIISQRCLHPSYNCSPTVPVDQLLWLEHCIFHKYTPHIILMSSQLRTFIRVVDGSMVINVGQLVKHNYKKQSVSGTYCELQICPPKNNCWSPQTNISVKVVQI